MILTTVKSSALDPYLRNHTVSPHSLTFRHDQNSVHRWLEHDDLNHPPLPLPPFRTSSQECEDGIKWHWQTGCPATAPKTDNIGEQTADDIPAEQGQTDHPKATHITTGNDLRRRRRERRRREVMVGADPDSGISPLQLWKYTIYNAGLVGNEGLLLPSEMLNAVCH